MQDTCVSNTRFRQDDKNIIICMTQGVNRTGKSNLKFLKLENAIADLL